MLCKTLKLDMNVVEEGLIKINNIKHVDRHYVYQDH